MKKYILFVICLIGRIEYASAMQNNQLTQTINRFIQTSDKCEFEDFKTNLIDDIKKLKEEDFNNHGILFLLQGNNDGFDTKKAQDGSSLPFFFRKITVGMSVPGVIAEECAQAIAYTSKNVIFCYEPQNQYIYIGHCESSSNILLILTGCALTATLLVAQRAYYQRHLSRSGT